MALLLGACCFATPPAPNLVPTLSASSTLQLVVPVDAPPLRVAPEVVAPPVAVCLRLLLRRHRRRDRLFLVPRAVERAEVLGADDPLSAAPAALDAAAAVLQARLPDGVKCFSYFTRGPDVSIGLSELVTTFCKVAGARLPDDGYWIHWRKKRCQMIVLLQPQVLVYLLLATSPSPPSRPPRWRSGSSRRTSPPGCSTGVRKPASLAWREARIIGRHWSGTTLLL